MGGSTRVVGKMESSMVMELTPLAKERSEKASGMMESGFVGQVVDAKFSGQCCPCDWGDSLAPCRSKLWPSWAMQCETLSCMLSALSDLTCVGLDGAMYFVCPSLARFF